MGGPAKKENAEGKMKAVPGVTVFLGGTIGEHGKLSLDPTAMNGGAGSVGVPIEDLTPVLVQTIIEKFGGKIKPEFKEEHEEWQAARAAADKAMAEEAAAKEAAKAAKKAKAAAAKAAKAKAAAA